MSVDLKKRVSEELKYRRELMAESKAVAEKAIKKLEDQLTCAICLDDLKDPKLLQCFHVYCKACLQRVVVQDQQGQVSLRCPTCRQTTLLPPGSDASALQSAFHVHHLLEIKDALEKVKEPENVKCEKCNKSRTATKFCRDCGKFICERCLETHSDWEELSKHEVVSIEEVKSNAKQLVPPKKVSLYCSHHQGKELDLYCETCGELICLHCTVKKHKDHQYDLVSDAFERHEAEMTASLEPIDVKVSIATKVMGQLGQRSQELRDLRAGIEADIQREIKQHHELLEARKSELIGRLDELINVKLKKLEAQKDEVETVLTQLVSCQTFVRQNLKTGSQAEVMKKKKAVMKQVKEVTTSFNEDTMSPCESADVRFTASSQELMSAYQQFGEVFIEEASPERCYATGKGLEVADPGERATAVLHVVDTKGNAYTRPVETVTCELESDSTGEKIKCAVKKTEGNRYEISYQATSRGRHQLHIKVEGDHIKGSPFPVTVKLPVQKLGTPVKTMRGLDKPWGVAVNQKGNIIVAECGHHCVSIFSPEGEIKSFGSRGSDHGQLNQPRGVTVDGDYNILVVDSGNHRIQKFTSDGNFITAVGKCGSKRLEFNCPIGIGVHPRTGMVYVTDSWNHRIQILNSDLTFYSNFGSRGDDNGQFQSPYDVAFDSTGNVYVADSDNNRIQVFTAEGKYLRKFRRKGKGSGELAYPTSISIDSDDQVYVAECGNDRVLVFMCDGEFLTSLGSQGSGPGQFDGPFGVTVDKNGLVYVTDRGNKRIQIF